MRKKKQSHVLRACNFKDSSSFDRKQLLQRKSQADKLGQSMVKSIKEAEKRIDDERITGSDKLDYVLIHNRALDKSKQILNDCLEMEND